MDETCEERGNFLGKWKGNGHIYLESEKKSVEISGQIIRKEGLENLIVIRH